jgi:hypothetical protein
MEKKLHSTYTRLFTAATIEMIEDRRAAAKLGAVNTMALQ